MRRDRAAGWLGGVCAGIARRYGIDPALVRLAFVVATAAGGFGVALYALLWLVVPSGEARRRRGHVPHRRGRRAGGGGGLRVPAGHRCPERRSRRDPRRDRGRGGAWRDL